MCNMYNILTNSSCLFLKQHGYVCQIDYDDKLKNIGHLSFLYHVRIAHLNCIVQKHVEIKHGIVIIRFYVHQLILKLLNFIKFCANRQIIVRGTWNSIFSPMILVKLIAMIILNSVQSRILYARNH